MAVHSPKYLLVRTDSFPARWWFKRRRVHVFVAAFLAVSLVAVFFSEWSGVWPTVLILVAIVPCAAIGLLALSAKKVRESSAEELERFPPKSDWETRLAIDFGATDTIGQERQTSPERPASASGDMREAVSN